MYDMEVMIRMLKVVSISMLIIVIWFYALPMMYKYLKTLYKR